MWRSPSTLARPELWPFLELREMLKASREWSSSFVID
jgi:hypothetical protein